MSTSAMRRVVTTAALVAIVALVAAGASIARAGSGSTTESGAFTLTETQTASRFVQVNTKSLPGNEFIFHSTLSNSGGQQVGTLDVVCIVVLGHQGLCHGLVTFKNGTLSVTAMTPLNNKLTTIHITIDGGTGAYDDAHGQVTSVQKTGKVSLDTFDIDGVSSS
jgi:hypothetical protein